MDTLLPSVRSIEVHFFLVAEYFYVVLFSQLQCSPCNSSLTSKCFAEHVLMSVGRGTFLNEFQKYFPGVCFRIHAQNFASDIQQIKELFKVLHITM